MIDRLDTFWILRMYSLQLSIMKVYIDRVMFTLPYNIYTCIYIYIHVYIYIYTCVCVCAQKRLVKCHNTPNNS